LLGYDGTPSEATLDPTIPTASQQSGVQAIYNLGVGTYDVSISTGPSYNTLRQEAATSMVEMVQANPALMQVIGDLMIKNMDWPGAEEISERLKLTLPPEIQQAEMQKKQKGMPPEMQQIVSQFEQAMQQKDQMLQEAQQMMQQMQMELQKEKTENEARETEAEAKKTDTIIKAVETEIRAYDAETKRLQVVQQAMSPEQIQQIVVQTLIDLAKPNTVELPPPEMEQEQEMQEMPQEAAPANMPPQGMETMME
jgi:hypothetical protein